MTTLARDVAAFAKNLENELTKFIDSLPTPAELMRLAINEIKQALISDDGLCLAPSCPGYHINSGKEQDIVPGNSDVLEILASHLIAHTPFACHQPPTRNAPQSRKHRQRMAPPHHACTLVTHLRTVSVFLRPPPAWS